MPVQAPTRDQPFYTVIWSSPWRGGGIDCTNRKEIETLDQKTKNHICGTFKHSPFMYSDTVRRSD